MKTRLKEATRWFRSLGLLLVLGLQSLPAAEEIIVRASLDEQSVWVGQRVQLQVDVLGRNGWAQAKPAKEITLPGSYVLPETPGYAYRKQSMEKTTPGSATSGTSTHKGTAQRQFPNWNCKSPSRPGGPTGARLCTAQKPPL